MSVRACLLDCLRQRDQAQQKDALELELIALKKSMGGTPGYSSPTRRGSQVMFGAAANGGPLGQQTSAPAVADEENADRLAGELEEAEEQISAMSSTIKQQVVWLHLASSQCLIHSLAHIHRLETGAVLVS